MHDQTARAALARHWQASDASDFEAEHDIYTNDQQRQTYATVSRA
jgi:hypothetical protein